MHMQSKLGVRAQGVSGVVLKALNVSGMFS